jgi:hypothetical protein
MTVASLNHTICQYIPPILFGYSLLFFLTFGCMLLSFDIFRVLCFSLRYDTIQYDYDNKTITRYDTIMLRARKRPHGCLGSDKLFNFTRVASESHLQTKQSTTTL